MKKNISLLSLLFIAFFGQGAFASTSGDVNLCEHGYLIELCEICHTVCDDYWRVDHTHDELSEDLPLYLTMKVVDEPPRKDVSFYCDRSPLCKCDGCQMLLSSASAEASVITSSTLLSLCLIF